MKMNRNQWENVSRKLKDWGLFSYAAVIDSALENTRRKVLEIYICTNHDFCGTIQRLDAENTEVSGG